MTERHYEAGETLFTEGQPSREVAIIREGLADVVRRVGDGFVVLGRIGPGETAGEMGVLERRPRSATVRALEPVTAELLERDAFLARIAAEPALALAMLQRLSERLHALDDRLVEAAGSGKAPTVTPGPFAGKVRLFGDSPAMERALGADGITIGHLPFRVGRDDVDSGPLDLALHDHVPYRLSRQHFRIDQGSDGIVVSDSHSTLGTLVDEAAIGELFPRSFRVLGPGEHRIVAGGEGSPFAFQLVIG